MIKCVASPSSLHAPHHLIIRFSPLQKTPSKQIYAISSPQSSSWTRRAFSLSSVSTAISVLIFSNSNRWEKPPQFLIFSSSKIPAELRRWIFASVTVKFPSKAIRLLFITMEGWQQSKDGSLIQHMITKMKPASQFLSTSSLGLGKSYQGLKQPLDQ